MKLQLQNPLFVVADMERSKNFYKTVLGLEPVSDFGANVVLEGGLALQTLDSWAGFLGKTPEEIAFGGTLTALIAANPQIKNPNLIYPGDRVRIP